MLTFTKAESGPHFRVPDHHTVIDTYPFFGRVAKSGGVYPHIGRLMQAVRKAIADSSFDGIDKITVPAELFRITDTEMRSAPLLQEEGGGPSDALQMRSHRATIIATQFGKPIEPRCIRRHRLGSSVNGTFISVNVFPGDIYAVGEFNPSVGDGVCAIYRITHIRDIANNALRQKMPDQDTTGLKYDHFLVGLEIIGLCYQENSDDVPGFWYAPCVARENIDMERVFHLMVEKLEREQYGPVSIQRFQPYVAKTPLKINDDGAIDALTTAVLPEDFLSEVARMCFTARNSRANERNYHLFQLATFKRVFVGEEQTPSIMASLLNRGDVVARVLTSIPCDDAYPRSWRDEPILMDYVTSGVIDQRVVAVYL